MPRKRNAFLGVGAAALLALPAAAEVPIGSLGAITGPIVSLVKDINAGERAAVAEMNAGGGVLGEPARLIEADTACNSQTAVDAATKLVNVEQVVAIAGALCSSATIPAASNVAVPAGVLMISPASTSPAITDLEDNDFLFRTAPSDAFQGHIMAKLVASKGIDKVALTYLNNDYGVGLADTFRKTFTAGGGEIAGDQAHEDKKQSYRSELASLAAGGAEVLVVIGYADGSGLAIIKQALEGGLFKQFVGGDGMKSDSIVEAVGAENLEGMFFGTAPVSAESASLARFNELYGASEDFKAAGPFVAQAYDAVMLIGLAVQKAGSRDRTAIRDALREVSNAPGEVVGPGDWEKAVALLAEGKDINYEGAAGSHEFDERGEVAGVFGEWSVSGGKVTDGMLLK